MIIDYHSHIKWDRDTNQYDTAALLQDMEENQIDKRVVSALAGFSTREQNSAVAELVKANPDRIIGSAVINPKERGCVEEMERIADTSKPSSWIPWNTVTIRRPCRFLTRLSK
mgnify:CR=1 FL=1